MSNELDSDDIEDEGDNESTPQGKELSWGQYLKQYFPKQFQKTPIQSIDKETAQNARRIYGMAPPYEISSSIKPYEAAFRVGNHIIFYSNGVQIREILYDPKVWFETVNRINGENKGKVKIVF